MDEKGRALEEFYCLGVRSPHRMTYDPDTGLTFLGDVGDGPGSREKINIIKRRGNYQWPWKVGDVGVPPLNLTIGDPTDPLYHYGRENEDAPFNGSCVIGGYVYRGNKHPNLYGKYIFGDNMSRRIWSMDFSKEPVEVTYLVQMPGGIQYTGLSSFGLDRECEIYMLRVGDRAPTFIYQL